MRPRHTSNLAENPTDETAADVLILGAGISGLSCAAALVNAGLRVVILEARQRIGGRLHTLPFGGGPGQPTYLVDLGGGWIHGIGSSAEPNQLYSLACQLGLDCRPTDYSDAVVYDAHGVRLTDSAVADIDNLYRTFEQHLHSLLNATDPRLALMPIQAALDAFTAARGLPPSQRALLAFAVSNHIEHYWAGEAKSMGVAALDEQILPGGDVVLAEGYHSIIRRLAEGLDVRFGHEVLSVQYGTAVSGAGVTVTARVSGVPSAAEDGGAGSGAAGMEVDGSLLRLTARAAVVTLPLGVLRSGAVAFSPTLGRTDPAKAAALGRLGTAVYNKVVLLFDPADVFWDDTTFLYRMAPHCEGGLWSVFLNVHKVTGAPILVAFNLGEAAVALEAASDEATVAGALQALAGMYGETRVRQPRQAVVTRWGSDPHARMSYTYIPAGLTSAVFDDLARPVLGCLFFAGEATHRRAYGTAHGAFDSGLRAALDVAHELQRRQQQQQLMLWRQHPAHWSTDRVVRMGWNARRSPPPWSGSRVGAALGQLLPSGAHVGAGDGPGASAASCALAAAVAAAAPVLVSSTAVGGGFAPAGEVGFGFRQAAIVRAPTGGFHSSVRRPDTSMSLTLGQGQALAEAEVQQCTLGPVVDEEDEEPAEDGNAAAAAIAGTGGMGVRAGGGERGGEGGEAGRAGGRDGSVAVVAMDNAGASSDAPAGVDAGATSGFATTGIGAVGARSGADTGTAVSTGAGSSYVSAREVEAATVRTSKL